MKLRAMSLVLAAAAVFPAVASVDNLSLLGTPYGWQSRTDFQWNLQGLNDGSASFDGHYHGYATADGPVDGNYYILWEETKTVQTVRWFTSQQATTRGLTAFTLWSLNDGADPALEASWTKLGDYDVPDKQFLSVSLPAAVRTRAIKLSYTNQTNPLTGEFEMYDQLLTPLAVTVSRDHASPSAYGDIGNAVDGNMFSTYGSTGGLGGNGFVELELDGEQAVGGLHIYFRVQSGYYAAPSAFTIRAWDADANDGDGGWSDTLLADVTGWASNASMFSLDFPAGFSTQKIRLDITGPREATNLPGGSFGLHEIYLYAPVTVPEPVTMSLLALGGLALLRRRS